LWAYALLVAVPVAAAAALAALSTHALVRATGPLASAASTNAVDRVLVAVTAVVALAAGAGAVARRLGQPAVVGELACGVVLGPTVLGAVDPDVQHWLFPAAAMPSLTVLAQLGVILFMFGIGTELARGALRRSGGRARVVDAPAEQLPFAGGSVDTVVSTLVLCTVDAPDLALREIARVLRPDGQLLFIEHVRSDSPRLARWQDRLEKPWRGFARGCRCNRATAELIVACGLELDDLRATPWRAMPPIVRPLITGRARIGDVDG